MRAVVTTAVLLLALATALPPGAAQAQSVNETDAQALRDEVRRLNERLNRLEDTGKPQAVPPHRRKPRRRKWPRPPRSSPPPRSPHRRPYRPG